EDGGSVGHWYVVTSATADRSISADSVHTAGAACGPPSAACRLLPAACRGNRWRFGGSRGNSHCSAGRRCRATLYSSPSAPQVMISPDPPALTSGSANPLVGTLTVATAMLIAACRPVIDATPNASIRPNESRFWR